MTQKVADNDLLCQAQRAWYSKSLLSVESLGGLYLLGTEKFRNVLSQQQKKRSRKDDGEGYIWRGLFLGRGGGVS